MIFIIISNNFTLIINMKYKSYMKLSNPFWLSRKTIYRFTTAVWQAVSSFCETKKSNTFSVVKVTYNLWTIIVKNNNIIIISSDYYMNWKNWSRKFYTKRISIISYSIAGRKIFTLICILYYININYMYVYCKSIYIYMNSFILWNIYYIILLY